MEVFKKKRVVLFQGIQQLQTKVTPLINKTESCFESMTKLESFLKKLQESAAKFYEATHDLQIKLGETEADIALNEQCLSNEGDVIDLIVLVESKIAWFHAELEKERSQASILNNNSDSGSSNGSSGLRYATIMKEVEPPTFDGDSTKFAEWRAMFENLVHNNVDYTSTTKLFFLKKCFIGSAEKVVDHYPISHEGYTNAWKYITTRYGKPKAVVGGFFKKLLSLEQIKNENGIQNLLDATNSVIRGLLSAKQEVNDTMSRLIAYLTYIKLDENTRRDWDNHYTNLNEYPKFNEIDQFLQNRAHVASERAGAKKESDKKGSKETNAKKSFVATNAPGKKSGCYLCNGNHALYTCESFRAKDPKERYKIAKSKSLCILCLNYGHSAPECHHTNFKCRCGEPHNYLLHFGESPKNNFSNKKQAESKNDENKPIAETESKETIIKTSMSCSVESDEKTVLLPSAMVRVSCGDIVGKIRVLLDSCSQATLISDAAVKKLNLPVKKSAITSSISGIGPSSTTTSSVVDLIVASKKDKFRLEIRADIVPASAMKYSVNVEFPKTVVESLRNLPLADPAYLQSKVTIEKIDMIIGAEYFGKCLLNDSLTINSLDLRLTQFGWIVSGVVPQRIHSEKFVGFTRQTLDEKLTQFWEIEEAGLVVKPKTLEEEQCMRHFEETYSIGDDGKFIIRLPFKIDPNEIAHNRKRALSALARVEKNLNEEQRNAYCKFMREYQELGHMSIAEHDPTACFLPHHAVIRPDSATTPQRTVFNASAGSPSLNFALLIGALLQRDLFDILIAMRWLKFVFSADIEKMYRMIWVHLLDRKYQSIFWRDSVSLPILEFVLNTLTYGTGPASFIATKCLDVIASEVEKGGLREEVVENLNLSIEQSKEESQATAEPENQIVVVEENVVEIENLDQEVAKLIRENFYMDDFNGGAQTIEKAIAIQKRLHSSLKKRGFVLRKYASNCKEILKNIPPELLASNLSKTMTENLSSVAILGIEWQPEEDFYTIKINIEAFDQNYITKRIISSFIARTFDPLGLVSPVLIRGKLLLKTAWMEGKGWDDEVSQETSRIFLSYMNELKNLSLIKIPRYVFGGSYCELVGFADASSDAYCAAVYVRAKNEENDSIMCRLLASKTRVAPSKSLTVPKLELQACKLLVDLIERLMKNLKIPLSKIHAFSDSTVALCWLSKPSSEWQTFVSNRVEAVTSVIPFRQWSYVPSEENPADDATRGLEVFDFVQKSRWINGSDFMKEENYRSYFPVPDLATHEALERRKLKIIMCAVTVVDFTLKFSSYMRLLRTVAFILRVKNFVIDKKDKIVKIEDVPPLLSAEIEKSLKIVVRYVQGISFQAEIDRIKNNRPLKKRSWLKSLHPYLDEDGVLRVDGRLSNSDTLADEKKKPIILSSKSHFAKLYVRHIHEKNFHAGRTLIEAALSRRFWFVGGVTNLIKFVIRSCVHCAATRAISANQLMGALPRPRITIAPPFTHVGVDFAGPFQCKCTDHRSMKINQIYAAVFVCLTVRAVHIELVSGLSTEKFILAIQTFIARRGLPSVMYSDNATNFVGTKNFLLLDESQLQNYASSESFTWKFIPPVSPHKGGLWEAAVKSFKKHLYAATRCHTLNIEEYRTLFAKIEAVMNMRPLCYKKSVEQGSEVITPSHFLIGRRLMSIPAIEDEKINLSRRLELVQNLFIGFWKVWSKDYLNQLQSRTKWKEVYPNLKVGQIVLIKNQNTKPYQWPLGVIEAIYPDKQGAVRVVDVRFNGNTRRRNITSLVVLPVDTSN